MKLKAEVTARNGETVICSFTEQQMAIVVAKKIMM